MKTVRILLVLTLCGAANISQAMWNRFTSPFTNRFVAGLRTALANKKRIAATTVAGTGITALGFTGYNELMYRNSKYDYNRSKETLRMSKTILALKSLVDVKKHLDQDEKTLLDTSDYLHSHFGVLHQEARYRMESYKKHAYFTRAYEYTKNIYDSKKQS